MVLCSGWVRVGSRAERGAQASGRGLQRYPGYKVAVLARGQVMWGELHAVQVQRPLGTGVNCMGPLTRGFFSVNIQSAPISPGFISED